MLQKLTLIALLATVCPLFGMEVSPSTFSAQCKKKKENKEIINPFYMSSNIAQKTPSNHIIDIGVTYKQKYYQMIESFKVSIIESPEPIQSKHSNTWSKAEIEFMVSVLNASTVDHLGNTPLHVAASINECPQLLACLLESNSSHHDDLNRYNAYGLTPLHLALRHKIRLLQSL